MSLSSVWQGNKLRGLERRITAVSDRSESRCRGLRLRCFLSVLRWNWLQAELMGTGLFAAESVSVASGSETLRITTATSQTLCLFVLKESYLSCFPLIIITVRVSVLGELFLCCICAHVKTKWFLLFVFPLLLSVCSLSLLLPLPLLYYPHHLVLDSLTRD